MRKICILLCLSLFTSLIHATVMKAELPMQSSTHHAAAPDSSVHHCYEEVSKPSDTTPKLACHGSSYPCCLGLLVIPELELQLSINLTETLITKYSPLVPRTTVNLIYRPPKA